MTDATNNTNAAEQSESAKDKTKVPEQSFFAKTWGKVSKTVSDHRAKIAFIGGAATLYGVAAAVQAYREGSAAEAAEAHTTDGSSSM